MQDFDPDGLGPVKRPTRVDHCPRCEAPVPPGAVTCPACSVVLAKAHHVSTGVYRPPPPVIEPEQPSRTGPILLVVAVLLGIAGFFWVRRPASGPPPALGAAVDMGSGTVQNGTASRAGPAALARQVQGGYVPLAAEPQATPPVQVDSTIRDNNGHDEAWWRAREEGRQARLVAATNAATEATFIADSAANASGSSRLSQEAGRAQVAELQARATIAQRAVTAIEAEADALKEECRKANCYPGWLR